MKAKYNISHKDLVKDLEGGETVFFSRKTFLTGIQDDRTGPVLGSRPVLGLVLDAKVVEVPVDVQ
jgi:hypothetical protein